MARHGTARHCATKHASRRGWFRAHRCGSSSSYLDGVRVPYARGTIHASASSVRSNHETETNALHRVPAEPNGDATLTHTHASIHPPVELLHYTQLIPFRSSHQSRSVGGGVSCLVVVILFVQNVGRSVQSSGGVGSQRSPVRDRSSLAHGPSRRTHLSREKQSM